LDTSNALTISLNGENEAEEDNDYEEIDASGDIWDCSQCAYEYNLSM